jgi:hypothetical protein
MISKSLGWIADEFEKYRWVENKSMDGAIKEVPLKNDDDAMDAIRYMAMSYMKPEEVYERPRVYVTDSRIGV